jgi:hypothetical protein
MRSSDVEIPVVLLPVQDCDGDLPVISGFLQLLLRAPMLRLSYVRKAHQVMSIYEHNGSGGAVCALRISMRARNDGRGPPPVTP